MSLITQGFGSFGSKYSVITDGYLNDISTRILDYVENIVTETGSIVSFRTCEEDEHQVTDFQLASNISYRDVSEILSPTDHVSRVNYFYEIESSLDNNLFLGSRKSLIGTKSIVVEIFGDVRVGNVVENLSPTVNELSRLPELLEKSFLDNGFIVGHSLIGSRYRYAILNDHISSTVGDEVTEKLSPTDISRPLYEFFSVMENPIEGLDDVIHLETPINLGYLELRLSGGNDNFLPKRSLGGKISNKRIVNQSVRYQNSIPGIWINDALTSSSGVLSYSHIDRTVSWVPNNGNSLRSVSITGSGRYELPSRNADGSLTYLLLTVHEHLLPSETVSLSIELATKKDEVFDMLTKEETYLGHTEYRCFYLINTHPTESLQNLRLQIKKQPQIGTLIALGKDPAGIGDGNTTGLPQQVNLTTQSPSGVRFVPTTELDNNFTLSNFSKLSKSMSHDVLKFSKNNILTIESLGPGEACAIWERRSSRKGLISFESFDELLLSLFIEYS